MTDCRPVWLTREQRDAMQGASKRWPLLWDAVDAWDAAPADAEEAITKLIANESYYFGSADPLSVLRALGMPHKTRIPPADWR